MTAARSCRIGDRQRPHALRRLLGGRSDCAPAAPAAIRLCVSEQAACDRSDRRSRRPPSSNCSRSGGNATISSARRAISADDALDAAAIVRQPLGDAVDHVLLLGGEFEPGLLQQLAQRRGGLADLVRLGARIGDEIARGEPQLVHAPVDVLGEVADALQPLQLGKGRVDVADGDDAGHAGDR